MRNKGFFWFLTILLTAVCLYQLSFTWVATSVEDKASKDADRAVEELMAEAKDNGNKAMLPNGTEVDFSKPESKEIAKAAFVNANLKDKASTKVYPGLGYNFTEVKNRSLAFGLDLVGGMSVTLEVSIPDLVKNYARNPRDLTFKKPFEKASSEYHEKGGDFIDLFEKAHRELNPGMKDEMVRLFAISEVDGLDRNSSNSDVKDFLNDKVASSMDGVEEIMNRRINQFGVAQPNIQKDPSNNRLYIELPGVQDEATVSAKLQSTANLQFFETFEDKDIQPLMMQIATISQQPYISADEAENDTTATAAVDTSNVVAEDTTENSMEDIFSETDEAGNEVKGLQEYLKGYPRAAGYASPQDRGKVEEILNRPDVKAILPPNLAFMWSANLEKVDRSGKDRGYVLYAIKIPENGKAKVGGKDVKNATTGFDQADGQITVDLEMTTEGSEKWAQMTADNVGKIIAITMDSVVYSAPNVISAITGGRTQISGSFDIESAKDLAGLLNGGALPAPCVIKEQTRVGPTIGSENAQAGFISFGIALVIVFIYMFFYYGKAGLVADIALIANILFIFGSLASFGAVLTLAGIAGIVLTIGMAVDANVLIYERIREEQAGGRDAKSAVQEGFSKALSSIIDANVTTLLTAIVLKVFGSGPIESFATTLIIGIFTSLFAALVVTRLIITGIVSKNRELSFGTSMTQNAFKNFRIDFVGKRRIFYVISGTLIVAGAISLATRGLNLSVEFDGGRTYGVQFDKSAEGNLEYLKAKLGEVLVDNGTKASIDAKTKSNSYFVEITTNYLKTSDSSNTFVQKKIMEGLELAKDRLGNYQVMESRTVSASVSKELITSSAISIILSLIIIFAYIFIRFGKWQYSIGALLAIAHDVLLVLATFSIFYGILPFNMDVDQAFIAAILTVIGYSINDTVIVFDRIREDLRLGKGSDHTSQINGALNSTLSRTINTSMTTFVVLLTIFIFGGASIKGFVFALMVGVFVGTYSSLCIATPLLIDFSKKIKA